MTKNKNLFKNISLFFCLVPMLLLSLLVALPKKEIKCVYADYVDVSYTFVASDLYNIEYYYIGGSFTTLIPCLFSSNITFSNNVLNIEPFFNYCEINNNTISYTQTHILNNGYLTDDINVTRGESFTLLFNRTIEDYNNGNYFLVDGFCSANFNANVYKVVLELKDEGITVDSSRCSFLHITYYDVNNEYITFVFVVPINYAFNTRTYYINLDFTDSQYYNEGYSNGYNAGITDGNSSGYTDGYSAGQSFGYQNGYNAGLEQSGKYSFNSLIGAVIDAPVSAFTSLLNFEILGFNILGFITGLLTLALIVFIIKLCLGGK